MVLQGAIQDSTAYTECKISKHCRYTDRHTDTHTDRMNGNFLAWLKIKKTKLGFQVSISLGAH